MNKTNISVVGSIALDSLKTSKGNRENLLGGSATYFSIAASKFSPVEVIGIVGNDFPEEYWEILNSDNIYSQNIIEENGKTFRWGGEYNYDYSHRETLFTELGVFEHFKPNIVSSSTKDGILFLANIQPSLQMEVLNQIDNASLIVMDTMNLWIDNNYDELIEVIKKVDILLINDEEILQLTNNSNLEYAAHDLLGDKLKHIIIKRGGDGSLIVSNGSTTSIPAVPNINVFDPTGAGDSFAGGFLGYIASNSELNIINAVITGTAIASYTVSDFGIRGIKNLQLHNIEKRIKLITDLMKGL